LPRKVYLKPPNVFIADLSVLIGKRLSAALIREIVTGDSLTGSDIGSE
jgi:hypothetical protein